MSIKTIVFFLCVTIPIQGIVGLGPCDEWEHHTYGKGITCCHHKSLTTGISENSHWTECINHPTNEKENYTTSMWRVFTCVLEKSLPAGQKTISLPKFSELMTAKYPDDIKKKINDKVKEIGKNEKKKTWLTAEIPLTDYANIDKFRADYYNIEKKICGGPPKLPKGEEKGKKWTMCSMDEEIIHRAGDCCGTTTLPFVDHHHNHYQDFKPTNCEKTLQKKLDKLALKDKEDKKTFLEECQFSCYLIEKKLITIDHLLKLRVKDEIPTDKIVKDFVPVYISESVQKKMQDQVKTHLNRTYIMKDLVPNTMLGEKANHEELYGCYAYSELSELSKNALFDICHPNYSSADPDY